MYRQSVLECTNPSPKEIGGLTKGAERTAFSALTFFLLQCLCYPNILPPMRMKKMLELWKEEWWQEKASWYGMTGVYFMGKCELHFWIGSIIHTYIHIQIHVKNQRSNLSARFCTEGAKRERERARNRVMLVVYDGNNAKASTTLTSFNSSSLPVDHSPVRPFLPQTSSCW